jgi:hypothetical protein
LVQAASERNQKQAKWIECQTHRDSVEPRTALRHVVDPRGTDSLTSCAFSRIQYSDTTGVIKFRTRTLGEICEEVGGIIRTGPFGLHCIV